MKYWNGWKNFYEWALMNDYTKKCAHCGNSFTPKNGNQKYCNREDNPECQDDRYFQKLWDNNKHPLQLINK
jgi:hypothetical protein